MIEQINWKRTIYLGQPEEEERYAIGAAASEALIKSIAALRGSGPVYLLLNNDGGEDAEARFIIDIIRHIPQDIVGVVAGRAESAAAWILQACDWRIMLPASNLMFHMGSGTKDAHSEWTDRMFVDDVLRRLQEKDPAYPRNKLLRNMKHDWYIYPTQALALGLCDQVGGIKL